MYTTLHPLSPPSLDELADILRPALTANFEKASISVEQCPDLRKAPYHLAAEGLSGDESVADIGGQPNLFPEPRLDCKYDLLDIAKQMRISPRRGQLLGAGAGPFHVIGVNSELSPNLSWENSFENVKNLTYYTKFNQRIEWEARSSLSEESVLALRTDDESLWLDRTSRPSLKIVARARKGDQKSFTECIREALHEVYGDARPISMGGMFLIKTGTARFHIMPDFPPQEQLPFKDAKHLNDWLTYQDSKAPIICLSVFHSADPGKRLGLRIEHTHCFSTNGSNSSGHYHYDLPAGERVEEIE